MNSEFREHFKSLAESETDGEILEAMWVVAHEAPDGQLLLSLGGTEPISNETRIKLLESAIEELKNA